MSAARLFRVCGGPIAARMNMRFPCLLTLALLLALPADHPLTRKRTVSASDLEGEALIVMKEGHCLGDQVLNFCDRSDLHPNISFRSAQLETIQSLVCAEMGLSLIPAMAAKQCPAVSIVLLASAHSKDRRCVAEATSARPRCG